MLICVIVYRVEYRIIAVSISPKFPNYSYGPRFFMILFYDQRFFQIVKLEIKKVFNSYPPSIWPLYLGFKDAPPTRKDSSKKINSVFLTEIAYTIPHNSFFDTEEICYVH